MLSPFHSRLASLSDRVYSWLGMRSHSWLGITLGLWLILTWALPASALTVQDIPSPRAHGGWVSDTADQISPPMERRLNGLITFLEAKTTSEMAVVTISDTPPDISPKDFATELFNTWGVGKVKKNNGMLMLLSMSDRRIEIELGRGMEDVLPNDYLASLIQDTLRPLLQSRDVDQALWAGVGAIVADLTGIDPNAPTVLPWAPTSYTIFLVLGIPCLVGSILRLRWQYQQLAPLPPTGSEPFSGSLKLSEIDFDRLVQTTSHCPKRPFLPLLLLVCSFPLIAPALTFWVTSLWGAPFDTRTDLFLDLMVIPASAYGLLLTLYLDPWLHPVPGNRPFNLLEFLDSIDSSQQTTWQDRIVKWAIKLLILNYFVLLIGGGPFLLWLIYKQLWMLATPFTPALRISVAAPLFVALGNVAIATFYIQAERWSSRPTPGYCCTICQGDIVDLTSYSSELRKLLPYRPNTTYRAWHCPTCYPTLSQDGIFLFTEEKSPSTPSSVSARSQSRHSKRSQSRRSKPRQSSSYNDSSNSVGSILSSDSSDFGGGSSDGGGVGDNW